QTPPLGDALASGYLFRSLRPREDFHLQEVAPCVAHAQNVPGLWARGRGVFPPITGVDYFFCRARTFARCLPSAISLSPTSVAFSSSVFASKGATSSDSSSSSA